MAADDSSQNNETGCEKVLATIYPVSSSEQAIPCN